MESVYDFHHSWIVVDLDADQEKKREKSHSKNGCMSGLWKELESIKISSLFL